jgi:predicted ATP-dependent endonuclease of OLD family
MTFKTIKIENFKGLKEIEVPLSEFTCIVGENNAGKSTFIQSLLLFIKGTKLTKNDFFDPEKDILITVTLEDITDKELEVLAEGHKEKLEKHIKDGSLKLARRYSKDDYTSKLRNVTYIPILPKYRKEKVDENFKGKKGADLKDVLETIYHEIDLTEIPSIATQKAAKEIIEQYVESMPSEDLVEEDIALESGFDNTIKALFPEPIYIPAVKDLSDEMKTKDSASFGKLLNILLDVIEDDMKEAKEVFEKLREKLNKTYDNDGNLISDDRLEKVRQIEETIQKNLNATFKNVSIELEIPQPEIKTILSSANITADDGVKGPIDNKGDGFKRAITFSILRSYVELSHTKEWQKEETSKQKDKFLFLFEEPELYLHPKAQNILFEALVLIAKKHQMIVTTHSPLFFSADDTKTFIKIKKYDDGIKPFANALHIDLTDVSRKDKFQLISYETSNQAFFADKIVLVEGDSELIVLPHIAKIIDPKYDFKNNSVSLVKINGKGSFKRYKDFFEKFDVEIHLITDLDIVTEGFSKLDVDEDGQRLRDDLLSEIDKIIEEENKKTPVNNKYLKEQLQKEKRLAIFEKIKEARKAEDTELAISALEEFFDFEWTKPRLEILEDFSRDAIVKKKRTLFNRLREDQVFILEKGAIEAYYPDDITKDDKPSMAQSFCEKTSTREDLTTLCNKLEGDKLEFEVILDQIFNA